MSNERNPVFIPDAPVEVSRTRKTCAKCGQANYTGRMINGILHSQCLTEKCGATWSGGSEAHVDPTVPRSPSVTKPTFSYEKGQRVLATGEIEETINTVENLPSTVQEFRTGAPVPDDEGEYL